MRCKGRPAPLHHLPRSLRATLPTLWRCTFSTRISDSWDGPQPAAPMPGSSFINPEANDAEGKGGIVKLTKRIKERGTAIYVTAVILVMAVPMAGLAIDGSILYILKC